MQTLSSEEFQTLLSNNADELNAFLARNGFTAKIDPLPAGQFGTAAIVRYSAEWCVAGSTLDHFKLENGTVTPGVSMTKKSFSAYSSSVHPHPIGAISAKNGTVWHLTKIDKALAGLDLFDYVKEIRLSLCSKPAGVMRFPKVDFDQIIKPEVMIGLQTFDQKDMPWEVSQCVQQTRIKMNHLGGIAESAAMTGFRCMAALPKPTLDVIVDGPALLWINKKGCQLPQFVAVFGYDSFNDPGELEFGKPLVG